MRRLIFALVGILIFLASLLSPVFQSQWYVLLIFGILLAAVAFLLSRSATARGVLGRVLNFCLRTNNRWLVTMLVMTVISFGLAFFTTPGYPVIKTEVDQIVAKGASQRLEKISQRYDNLYFHGEYKTDAELQKQTPTPKPLLSWTAWWTRWVCSLLLLVLTIGYIPFAFSDEVRRAFQHAEQHIRERAGGEIGGESLLRSFVRRLMGEGPTPSPATPPPTTTIPAAETATQATAQAAATAVRVAGRGGSGSWMKIFLIALLAEIVGERFFERRLR